jgi:hypothetical protein
MLGRVGVLAAIMQLVACINFEPFQPPPPVYKQWKKEGARQIDIQKSMLECGYLSPYGNPGITDMNSIVLMHRCMEASGYVYNDGAGDFCSGFKYQPPACNPKTPAPQRKVVIRINSKFCHAHQHSPICGP